LFSTSLTTRSSGSVSRASQRFLASHHMTVPLGLAGRSAFHRVQQPATWVNRRLLADNYVTLKTVSKQTC
jgi:hypothetical protein